MPRAAKLHTHTRLAEGMAALFTELEKRLGLQAPLKVTLAGGMAVHLYTANRVTTDVDAEFGARVLLPTDLVVDVTLEDGSQQAMYLDTNFNPTFALMHEGYLDDAQPVDLRLHHIKLYVLAPVDLAVSKIARWADNDKEDVAALVRLGLTDAKAIERRATEALAGYVGGVAMLKLNLRDALTLARASEFKQT